jgi:hypothetical protein
MVLLIVTSKVLAEGAKISGVGKMNFGPISADPNWSGILDPTSQGWPTAASVLARGARIRRLMVSK